MLSSVHNIRIERLWFDVTKQLGAKWADFFQDLELRHGLDINNSYHIWLLHTLFLQMVNDEIDFFIKNWNSHRLQMRGQRSRSPIDLFEIDMLSCGIRGDVVDVQGAIEEVQVLDAEEMGADLETYGVDWEDLQSRVMIQSHTQNNPVADPTASWIGRRGPPPHLNPVELDPPDVDFDVDQARSLLWGEVSRLHGDPLLRSQIWVESLMFMRSLNHSF